MKTTQFDTTWYVEQQRRIEEADVRAALARRYRRVVLDEGHVYVVEFDSGVVKVGKTTNPKSRLSSHAKAGLIRASWFSERHYGCSANERTIIDFCRQHGEPTSGKEYFRRLDFGTIQIFAALTVKLAQIDATVAAMLEGCGGDLDANAVEAWQRVTGDDTDDAEAGAP